MINQPNSHGKTKEEVLTQAIYNKILKVEMVGF